MNDIFKSDLNEEDKSGIKNYLSIIQTLIEMNKNREKVSEIIGFLVDYFSNFIRDFDKNAQQKLEFFDELRLSAEKIDKEQNEENLDPISLFLEHIDSMIETSQRNSPDKCVMISTLHGSKGLEWDYVFIPGLEEGILPHRLSETKKEKEEERRLLFVGMTRAKTKLYLSSCRIRNFGQESEPCSFLSVLKKSPDVHFIDLTKEQKEQLERGDYPNPSDRTDSESSFVEEEEEEDFRDISPNKINRRLMMFPPDVSYH